MTDETNPPTKPNTAVLVNPDTEIFVAPRPRHKSKAAEAKSTTPSQPEGSAKNQRDKSNEIKKPLSSIKQATDVPSSPVKPADAYPWIAEAAKASPSAVQTLPFVHFRTIPPAVFCQWDDCLQSLEAEISSSNAATTGNSLGDGRRWMIWANRKTLKKFARRTGMESKTDRILVEAIPSQKPETGPSEDAGTEEGESTEPRSARKNRKAVLRALDGMPVDRVFIWPTWGSEGDVDAAWQVEDWDSISYV